MARVFREPPVRVPFDLVSWLGTAVELSARAELLSPSTATQPGTIRASELLGRPASATSPRGENPGRVTFTRRSETLGRATVGQGADALGRVTELVAEGWPGRAPIVTRVVVARGLGWRLTNPKVHGPWLLRQLASALRGEAKTFDWQAIRIDY